MAQTRVPTRPEAPTSTSVDPFWRLALLWLPALTVIALSAVASTAGLGHALLLAAALLMLAELALLAARSRHYGVNPVGVAVAIIGAAGITATVLLLLLGALFGLRCGSNCDGLS